MATTTDEILKERASTHGSYDDIVRARAYMLEALVDLHIKRYKYIDYKLIVMWNDILLKLARSAANPSHMDNWDDLEGYARIINDYMHNNDLGYDDEKC